MGFELAVNEERIPLTITRQGVDYKLTHILRNPTNEERIEYKRKLFPFKGRGRKMKPEDHSSEAASWFWHKLCVRVEGYTFEGKDLMEREDWKNIIPIDHQESAINNLPGAIGDAGEEEDEKN